MKEVYDMQPKKRDELSDITIAGKTFIGWIESGALDPAFYNKITLFTHLLARPVSVDNKFIPWLEQGSVVGLLWISKAWQVSNRRK